MEIVRVKTWDDFVSLTILVKSNQHKEYRCSDDDYIKWLNKKWYNSNTVMYIVKSGNTPVAYTVLDRVKNVMRNDLLVVNIYVVPEHQGKRVINIMIGEMVRLAVENNMRIMWDSFALPESHWLRYIKDFGLPAGVMKVKKVYWVDINDINKIENREQVIQNAGG
ncbi:MAG: hypothetical protein DRJ03_18245 [Chloroflexi bacterium]|nr:MAG: hypothetical protein DRJ03_18245 [Chloroflexota bacterium]